MRGSRGEEGAETRTKATEQVAEESGPAPGDRDEAVCGDAGGRRRSLASVSAWVPSPSDVMQTV